PNCYFPKIGVPNEIDTIYGAENNQQLGRTVGSIGHLPSESYAQIAIGNLYPHSNSDPIYPIVSTGPSFNLHKLEVRDTLKMGDYNWRDPLNIIKRGHFRSKENIDVLYGELPSGVLLPRLYLSNNNGRYDSTHFIQLSTHFEDSNFFHESYGMMEPYCTYLTSDTVEDIVCAILKFDTLNSHHLLYGLLFKGGNPIWQTAKFIYPDSIFFIDTIIEQAAVPYRICTQGDFRGVGREDLIAADRSGNAFYYKNESPFSMKSFFKSLANDTLVAQWQNPTVHLPFNGNMFEPSRLTMQAFPRGHGDNAVDFIPDVVRSFDNVLYHDICFFKGGPEFGSGRLLIDSADYIIPDPRYYDSKFDGIGFNKIYNCGNMTGTGNPVLMVSAGSGFYSAFYFYVLGNAMDDKIDMFFEVDDFANFYSLDTLVADGDGLQDIIMGLPGYYSHEDLDSGKQGVGTVFVVHGSKKIPVKNSSVVSQLDAKGRVSIYPNPAEDNITAEIYSEIEKNVVVKVIDVLGIAIKALPVHFHKGSNVVTVNMLGQSAGVYVLQVGEVSQKFVVKK
ncbi:MAG TPA: T9SS type A sorting domain-containing protein, partial [Candidatus Kapabacteria bacterium]|nr:T9SS type A sorting domain-containing protein [Candidatus Kapabacteria bacterium]